MALRDGEDLDVGTTDIDDLLANPLQPLGDVAEVGHRCTPTSSERSLQEGRHIEIVVRVVERIGRLLGEEILQ